jgi:hypothetical protein
LPARCIVLQAVQTVGVKEACLQPFRRRVPAQVVVTHGPQIGSSNPITADPPVERPHTTPCTVQLFTNEQFADFNIKDFNYAPHRSATVPGPRLSSRPTSP